MNSKKQRTLKTDVYAPKERDVHFDVAQLLSLYVHTKIAADEGAPRTHRNPRDTKPERGKNVEQNADETQKKKRKMKKDERRGGEERRRNERVLISFFCLSRDLPSPRAFCSSTDSSLFFSIFLLFVPYDEISAQHD